jgi:hypothetical protein
MSGIGFSHLLRRAPGTEGESSLNLRETVIIRLVARQIQRQPAGPSPRVNVDQCFDARLGFNQPKPATSTSRRWVGPGVLSWCRQQRASCMCCQYPWGTILLYTALLSCRSHDLSSSPTGTVPRRCKPPDTSGQSCFPAPSPGLYLDGRSGCLCDDQQWVGKVHFLLALLRILPYYALAVLS